MSEYNENNNKIKELIKSNIMLINISKSARDRFIKNCSLNENEDTYQILRDEISTEFETELKGKNIYVKTEKYIFTINRSTMNLITAHINDFEIEEEISEMEIAEIKEDGNEDESLYGRIVASEYVKNGRIPSIILQIEDRLGECINNIIGAKVHVNENGSLFIDDKTKSTTYDLREKDANDLIDFGFLEVEERYKRSNIIEPDIESAFLDMPCSDFYIPKNINEVANFKGSLIRLKDKFLNSISKSKSLTDKVKKNSIVSVLNIFS